MHARPPLRTASRATGSFRSVVAAAAVFALATCAVPALAVSATAGKPFDATLTHGGVGFHVASANAGSTNTLTIEVTGLETGHAPISREIDGTVAGAEVADLDGDGSPELYVYATSAGSGSYGSLVAYAVNGRRSLSEIYLPPFADSGNAAEGYMGHDRFEVRDRALVRTFPVYRPGDTNANPTAGTRQLRYTLARGENGWILRLQHVSGGAPAGASGPSFDCARVSPGSIERQVCDDERLSALDRELARVYAAAASKAKNEHPPVLKAEQRGWIKGRNECWKAVDRRACIESAYVLRIAELQARYRLVEAIGPVVYACGGDPRNEVVVTFFRTDPGTLIAERGDRVSLMYQQRSASGARYQGRNESLWEHHGEALITWGYGSPEMRCVKK